MKRLLSIILALVMVLSSSVMCFAATDEATFDEPNQISKGGNAEIQAGRHYNVKEEVEEDRITNEWLYPEGKSESTALKKVYCKSCIHYEVYRMRVGDPDYKDFLYDEYKTTWKGYVRKTTSDPWTLKYDYKNQITRDRGAFIDLLI